MSLLRLHCVCGYQLELSDNCTDLFTACAAWGELVLVAGHTVVFILVRDEGLRANRLFAAVTDEAALVPCGARVLQLPRTWQREGKMDGKKDRQQLRLNFFG